MKLRLEDEGGGWFWDRPAIEVDVIAQAWGHSRLYYKVRLQSAIELERSGESGPSGPSLAVYEAAWVSSRWAGHELSSTEATLAFVWPASGEGEPVPPRADSPPSARVRCRKLS